MALKRRWLALALLLAMLCACAAGAAEDENALLLYYRQQGEGAFESPTGALAGEKTALTADTAPQTLLARYLKGPEDQTLATIFPEGALCTLVGLSDGVLTLELNERFTQLSGAVRTLAAAGLTMTLTQLDGVTAVALQAPGIALSGQNQVLLTPEDFLLQDTSWQYPERVVQLYFAGQNGALGMEKRTLSYVGAELLPQAVLEALLKGPENRQLSSCLPANVNILDVSLSGTLCTVVLSEEFSACDTDRAHAALAVHSIVASLCALSEVEQVQLVLENVEDLQYCSIAAPLSPESDWYE